MLTERELLALLTAAESDGVERTASPDKPDKFGEAVCAFANDFSNRRAPGYLIIGVHDDGTLGGAKIGDDVLQTLGGIRSNGNVLPQPALSVQKFALAGGDVAVVEVLPSDLPPVRYKGRVWIRVGPRRAVASEQEERILFERRIASARSFDAQPCQGAQLDDLALGLFDAYRRAAVDAETIAANQRPIEHQLASLRFYDPQRETPTNAGILLFGKQPRFFLPGAYVQYLRFPGTAMTDVPVDQSEIAGDLQSVLHELEIRAKTLIQNTMVPVEGMREKIIPDYPYVALRELLMNAVMHRTYESNSPIRFCVFSDRIEIQGPGGLYGEATPQNFPTRNSYRNPIIAEAMKSLGFVNRFGYGVQRAQALLLENGNPPAEYEFDERSVLVRVLRRIWPPTDLAETRSGHRSAPSRASGRGNRVPFRPA